MAEHRPHSAAPARAGAARRDSGPVPLLPALMRSLRSVSVILTSPPQQAEGEVRITPTALRTNMQEGRSIQINWGEPGTAPGPGKSRPRFHVPPRPPSCLPPN